MRLLTYNEAAQILGMPLPTLYSKVCRKEIPHVRINKRCVRFEQDKLEQWISERRVEPQKQAE